MSRLDRRALEHPHQIVGAGNHKARKNLLVMTNMTPVSRGPNLIFPLQNWRKSLEGTYSLAPRTDRVHLQIMSELARVPE